MFGTRECLAVESAGMEMRGVVVRRVGKKTQIRDFVALPRSESHDDLPDTEILREFKERLGYRTRREAVFITPMARAVVIPMNRAKVAAMRRQQLVEAVKWEVEPFTGISGRLALTGVDVEDLKAKPGQVVAESDEVMVNISVLERNVYRAIKERFKLAGLKLVRIYPPEVCFYVPLLAIHEESDRGVFEIGPSYSSFALLRGGEPKLINTLSVTTDIFLEHLDGKTMPDLEESLKFILRQVPPPHRLALTGTGAMDSRIVEFIDALSPTGAEAVLLRRTSGLTATGQEEGPTFTSAAGAAMRELGASTLSRIGISDAVPYILKLRRNAYLMPLFTTVVFFAVLLGHYELMTYREKEYRKRIDTMKGEIQDKKRQSSQALTLQNELEKITKKIGETSKRRDFALSEADRTLELFIAIFTGVKEQLPATIGLTSIQQDYANPFRFQMTGFTPGAADVGNFAVRLNNRSPRMKVVVEQIGKVSGGKTYTEKEISDGRGKGKRKGMAEKSEGTKTDMAAPPRQGAATKGSRGSGREDIGGAPQGEAFTMTVEVEPKDA